MKIYAGQVVAAARAVFLTVTGRDDPRVKCAGCPRVIDLMHDQAIFLYRDAWFCERCSRYTR